MAMTEIQPIDPDELSAVIGGFSWDVLGRSALAGLLNGAAHGAQSGQGILKGALSGGIMGAAQGLAGQIGGGSQQAQPQQ